jgi:hypothetical protein
MPQAPKIYGVHSNMAQRSVQYAKSITFGAQAIVRSADELLSVRRCSLNERA